METIKCPYCAEEIKSEAKICKHCQKDLTTKDSKNLINNQIKQLKIEEDKKITENLAIKLENKLSKYPDNLKNKLKYNKSFLHKLVNMSDLEIESDIFKRNRNKNLKILWISTILIGFIFPIIYLFAIWLHPKKEESNIFINRFKNFKNYKIRIVLSLIFLLFFAIIYSANQEIREQELIEKQRIEKIENTIIKANYDIENSITDKDKVNIILELNNIQSLKINNKDIFLSGTTIEYTHNLELGENIINIIGLNGNIEKKVGKKIKRVTNEEYNEFKENEKARVEAEKKRKAELAEQQKLKREEENRVKKVEEQFSAWDGSHRALTRYLESTLKDPDSYEHIDTRYGILQDVEKTYYVKVVTQYRAKNSFGGYVIGNITAYFDIEGNPIKTENWLN